MNKKIMQAEASYDFYKEEVLMLHNEITRLNKEIETKNKRIKKIEDINKELRAIIKEYKYELGLQELENTSIVNMD